MSDIALLMTSVLKTKQLSPCHLLEQLTLKLHYGIEKSAWSQLSQLNFTAQITPPEFIHSEKILATTSSALAPLKVNKTQHESLSSLAESKIQNKDTENSHRYHFRTAIYIADGSISTSNQSRDDTSNVKRDIPPMPTLHFNDSGVAVRVLQRLLLSNGYRVRVDGTFGALTEIAVSAFQNRRNLAADGVVGQRTWYELTK
ncbi:MAG: peptidoglycan-binding domain-containing protein [Rhizonema sp. PD37]|nr:peptidoglycan-binding domain-containing protein [Rhizonema sp. PD37]